MEPGYISVQTHDGCPDKVRILCSGHKPQTRQPRDSETQIRYIAHFHDSEAAIMHVHSFLKRHLIDPDEHLYRTDAAHAIAAVRSVALRHREVFSDERLDAAVRMDVERLVSGHHRWQRRQDLTFRTIGAIGISLLLLNAFFLSLA